MERSQCCSGRSNVDCGNVESGGLTRFIINTIIKYLPILTLSLLFLTACGGRGEWRAVEVGGAMRCDSLHSAAADGSPLECRPWMEGDTLKVQITGLRLGWAYIILNVHGGRFSARLGGVPFHTAERPTFETVSRRLRLAKESYALDDTLCAEFDLRFRIAFPDAGEPKEWTFRGTVCEMIRTKDFDPFAVDNFMTFDLPTAIHEMGEPLERRVFGAEGVTKFRIELLNHFPLGAEFVCEEVTWDTSPEREISDEGRERLTIWYVERGGRWMPVEYRMWSADSQF